ncbi:MAG: hypothetical protein LBP33_09625 [Candidatus Adiutrix sp.]|jgi:hypothetical protein|nr:hypothetical protein [Candidatus Adiutrix sp.]
MDFLSSIGLLGGPRAYLGLLVAIPVLLILIYILYGLGTALAMLGGRWKTRIISGRLESLGKIVDSASVNTFLNVTIHLDGQPRPTLFKKLSLGPYLRKTNALRLGGRYILLARGKGLDGGQIRVLALSTGRTVHCAKKDILALGRLEGAQIFFLALICGLPGGIFLAPRFAGGAPELADLIAAGLACGLIPAGALAGLFIMAAAKMSRQAKARLEQFARTWRIDDEAVRTKALPPLAAGYERSPIVSLVFLLLWWWWVVRQGHADELENIIVFLGGLPLLCLPFHILRKILIGLTTAASAAPRPEMRRLRIIEAGEAKKKADGSIYFKNVVFEDPFSGAKKKVKILSPAANLIKEGLLDQGLDGLWMIQEGKAGHPAVEESHGSLKVAAYIEDLKSRQICLNLTDVLRLYNYKPFISPLTAGLAGAFIGTALIIHNTGYAPVWVDFLWLIPATALPVSALIMARRRIVAAVGRCLQKWTAINQAGSQPCELTFKG